MKAIVERPAQDGAADACDRSAGKTPQVL